MSFYNAVRSTASVLLLFAAQSAVAISFNDVAPARGLTHTGTTYGSTWTGDANGDGKPDLWLGNHGTGADPILYLSTPSGFVESTALMGLTSVDFHGATWADVNNDGNQDLLVVAGGGSGAGMVANQLFIGSGNDWQEQAATFNLQYPLARARHATFFDWNSDGFLDVALINKNERATPPEADSRIYTFNPTTQAYVEENFTIHDAINQSFAQLMFSSPTLGTGTPTLITYGRQGNSGIDVALSYSTAGFSNVNVALGAPPVSFLNDAAMGDFDNDGAQDIVILNSQMTLLLQGASGFTDETQGSGLTTNKSAFVIAADFNNDMLLDIYVARSDLSNDVNAANVLYENQGNGVFTAVSAAGGASGTLQGLASSATAVDYNNDGLMDIFATNTDNWFASAAATNGAPMQLFENTTSNGNGWLKIVLQGTISNRDGIGAVVTVDAGGVTQLREQNGGVHHRSQDDPRLHFGLAGNTQADTVTVVWPSGTTQQLANVAANQILTIVEQTGGNVSPTARFTTASGSTDLAIDFDASTSSDPDGTITTWSWDFGDSNTANGETPTHEYAAAGTYSVALTVTDNDLATHTLTKNVMVGNTGSGSPVKAAVSVAAVGARAYLQELLIDELIDTTQNLATFWRNDNTLASGWVTLDLGSVQSIREIRVAPRAKKQHVLELTVGNSLSGGQVSNGESSNCIKPILGSSVVPSSLFTCTLDTPTTGRYITVRSTNRLSFRIYGIEVWIDSAGGGNQPPVASFTRTANLLQVDFDASSSTDSDGTISSWEWDFGDTAQSSGETVQHSYAASGSFTVQLTVTDNEGAQATSEQTINVSDGSAPTRLPATIEAVGARASISNKLIDETAQGEQVLSSRWANNGMTSTAWFTLDMGAGAAPSDLQIAPRADRAHSFEIRVGDTLSGGKVTGAITDRCNVAITGASSVPTGLTSCALSGTIGRYITVQAPTDPYQRIYGVELYQ